MSDTQVHTNPEDKTIGQKASDIAHNVAESASNVAHNVAEAASNAAHVVG